MLLKLERASSSKRIHFEGRKKQGQNGKPTAFTKLLIPGAVIGLELNGQLPQLT